MILQGRNLTQNLTGADVEQLQTELTQLGYMVPSSESSATQFGTGTLAAVEQFQTAQGLAANGTVDAATAEALTKAIVLITYTVTGVVTSPSMPSVGSLVVQLVDQNVGGSTTFGTTQTGSGGSFEFKNVIVSPAYLKEHYKLKPDFQVRVASGTTLLATSKVQYGSALTSTINVALPPSATGLPSEYETLGGGLTSVYGGSLTTLKQNDNQQDLTYLSNRSGWDPRAVAMASLAAQFATITAPAPTTTTTIVTAAGAAPAQQPAAVAPPPPPTVSLQPEFYYALFRAGVPSDADHIFQIGASSAQAIWQQAVTQNVIPQSLAATIPTAVQNFQTLSANHVLTMTPSVGLSSLQTLIAPTLKSLPQQQQFAQLLAQNRDNWAAFWPAVQSAFGATTTAQLQLVGQLSFLSLNNATLLAALNKAEPSLSSASDLASRGYYSAAKWTPLIGTTVPPGLPGKTTAEQASNYALLLAAQVRLSFPTAVLGDQVKNGVVPIGDTAAVAGEVATFLSANQAQFGIGTEPVDAFIARTKVPKPSDAALRQIRRVQRTYQVTPDDNSMNVMLRHNLDSAYAITRYDTPGFVRAFQGELGGADVAQTVHKRAKQIFSSVLNIASAYATARINPTLGGTTPIFTGYTPPTPSNTVLASATLEELFGSLDYCNCSDCNSILSPAAYLVDLLHYIDQPSPSPQYSNPQDVLFGRRPDLQYLPLTCANTNTALPYIDLVNETLEYFVANGLSIQNYQGHDTGTTVTSAELLASPQYVNDAAYTTLQQSYFPQPLPFNRPLELLRQQFQGLGVALPDAMIAFRANDNMTNPPSGYGWSDIMIEQLGISRDEAMIFSSSALHLGDLYGIPIAANQTPAQWDAKVLQDLQGMNLQQLCQRLAITYDDLIAVLQTQFINPNASLIPMLSQLNAPFATIATLQANLNTPKTIAPEFIKALPAGLDATPYGGTSSTDYNAVVTWVTSPQVYNAIMSLITIANPSSSPDDCSGTSLQLQYSNPNAAQSVLTATDYIKLIRFVRFWQALQPLLNDADDTVTIPQTDAILAALYPIADLPVGSNNPANDASNRLLLDKGFAATLARAGSVFRALNMLSLTADSGLLQLLACWSPIGTVGQNSLYQSMFLTPTLLQEDPGVQTATISAINNGDVLTTQINQVTITHQVAAGETPAQAATAIANLVNTCTTVDAVSNTEICKRFLATAQGPVISIKAGFTVGCQVNGKQTEAYSPTSTTNPTAQTATLSGAITAGDVVITTIDGVPVQYTFSATDGLLSAAQNIAAAINGTTVAHPFSGLPLNEIVAASAPATPAGTVNLTAPNAGAPFTLACTIKAANAGTYSLAAPVRAGFTATVGGTVKTNDTMTTTINGVDITYPVAATDTTTAVLAASLAKTISTTVQVDPTTQLPLSSLVQATSANNVVTINAIDPATAFTLKTQASGTETYISTGPTPETQTATVAGTIPAGALLTTTINGLDLYYPVASGDTAAKIATNVANSITTSTQPDPVSNLPLPSVVSATAAGGTITVTAANPTTAFTLAVALTQSAYTAGRTLPPFADNGYGQFLSDTSQTLFGHEPTLCAACNVTGAEFAQIANLLGFDASTPLSLDTVSQLFRYGWLAHALSISVLEFLFIIEFAGLNPFNSIDLGTSPPVEPAILRLISLLQSMSAASLEPVQALYLLWNQDISGTSAPPIGDITALATTLCADFAAVESQFALQSDPNGTIAQGLMALVYGPAATDFFFGLLNATYVTSVPYSYLSPTLPQGVIDASGGLLSYDNVNKLLGFAGVLETAMQTAIIAAATVNTTDKDNLAPGNVTFTPASMTNIQVGTVLLVDTGGAQESVVVTAVTATTFSAITTQAHNGTTTAFPIVNDPSLPAALANLAVANAQSVGPFFATYPELQPLYAAYIASTDPIQTKRSNLLASFLPTLKRIRKEEQALASITAAVGSDPSFANALLQDPRILHADADPTATAVIDLTAIENSGLSVQYFLGDNPAAPPDQTADFIAPVAYVQIGTIAGTPSTGMVLTTTIDGNAVPYAAQATDTTPAILAGSVATAINAAITIDAKSGLPINRLVFASVIPPTTGTSAAVALTPLNPNAASSVFSLACGVTGGGGLTYTPGSQLPAGTGGNPIAVTWTGYLNVPQSGSYNFAIATDPGAKVSLEIDNESIPMPIANGVFSNSVEVSLIAGALVPIVLTVTSIKTTFALSWQSPPGIGWELIPAQYLYPLNLMQRLDNTYVRFLKATSVASDLSLVADEIAYLGTDISATVDTTCATTVAKGTIQITPLAMTNIGVGSALVIDTGTAQETVTVTAITPTAFTALTAQAHDGTSTPFPIVSVATPNISRGWLNFLPGQPNAAAPALASPNPSVTASLGGVLTALLDFSRMKQALSPNDERLMQMLQNPGKLLPNGQTAIISLTGWSQGSVNALLTQFFGNLTYSNVSSVEGFRQVYDAYQIVATCRIAASTLISAVTNAPSPTVVSALQSALRALYAESDWLTVIQPINDAMRIMQRDALVAYILQGFSNDAQYSTIQTPDELYEFFLIDPETQPPVDTSRIRLALSTVQLFIERIVRGLEPLCSPNDIDATQWEWMKRYRVWEANREVFLWPENWLYPQLRDDQSEIFQTVMSGLLQSDLTDDSATSAYLDYLSSLEEVAKLEPCGIYYIGETADTNETCYMIARTAGAHRKYFFRTLQGGSWTPWTEVKIECEDMPLTPVVWNTENGSRLFLFWLKILKSSSVDPSQLPGTDPTIAGTQLTDASIGQLSQAAPSTSGALANIIVSAVLCWSEYYNGKWQPMKTSDVSKPTSVGLWPTTGSASFDADRILTRIVPATCTGNGYYNATLPPIPPGSLILAISTDQSKFGDPFDDQPQYGGFILHNTHSLPIRFEDVSADGNDLGDLLDIPAPTRVLRPQNAPYTGGNATGTFGIDYYSTATQFNSGNPAFSASVVDYFWQPRYIEPQPMLADIWEAPFLYEDRRHLFYVTTAKTTLTFPFYPGFGTIYEVGSVSKVNPVIPPLTIGPVYNGVSTIGFASKAGVVYQGQMILPNQTIELKSGVLTKEG